MTHMASTLDCGGRSDNWNETAWAAILIEVAMMIGCMTSGSRSKPKGSLLSKAQCQALVEMLVQSKK
jgi:hypothetical protein